MTVFSALSHLAAEWRSAREEARTHRILNSLPAEIQKDIGYRTIALKREPASGSRMAVQGRSVAG